MTTTASGTTTASRTTTATRTGTATRHGGDNSADQTAENKADSEASNEAWTEQNAGQEQSAGSDCKYGCGGSGQAQKLEQDADTHQYADSEAKAEQDAANANAPVTIGGGKYWGGDNSASQMLENKANSKASNEAATIQDAGQAQSAWSGSWYGGGGPGQSQKLRQDSDTHQKADSKAKAWQHGANANAPVIVWWGKKGKHPWKAHR